MTLGGRHRLVFRLSMPPRMSARALRVTARQGIAKETAASLPKGVQRYGAAKASLVSETKREEDE